MTRYGPMYGPDITFLGVDRCDLTDPASLEGVDVVILGAPFDGGTSHRPGARFGPSALRQACYLAHDGSRPSLALRVDGLRDLTVRDAGDVECFSGDLETSIRDIEAAVHTVAASGAIPVVLGGDHSIALPDARGVARHHGFGRVSMIHFDAHADTGDIEFGHLYGHGQPMRRLIESGAIRGDRFLQIGLRGYWPGPEVLSWMAAQNMRSYEMTEIVHRGLSECLTEAFAIALDDCDGVFLSIDIDVCDPGHAPGTGTPEPGGLSARELLDSVRRICYELPVVGLEVVEVAPPYDHADITALLGNRVVLEALSAIARRRSGDPWDPRRPLLDGR
ncbi:agmatinase [Herbidospora daliensis]|uniref:agmatinase n=1 Tax=Herbidospora daliensis TaxID=295585 RepID=UPI000783690E|nr:agmatinase [Herbidospora daliensis]